MQISWESFSIYNHDTQGIRFKFEDLCRQIFINQNISENKQFRYPHANPNNYGLETEPIFDEIRKRWIGFQAKYFENAVDYSQIEESAKKIIKYYTGKNGCVNHVFLFSNKPITSTATAFVRVRKLLEENNVSLELITDTAILDIVRSKYEYLGRYYFDNHTLNYEWFQKHTEGMYEELGERFNCLFHINTDESNKLSLFVNDEKAVAFINDKKAKTLENAQCHYSTNQKRREYLSVLRDTVASIPDVTVDTLYDSFKWKTKVCKALQNYIDELTSQLKDLDTKRQDYSELHNNDEQNNEVQIKNEHMLHSLINDIEEINKLLELTEGLTISDTEARLLQSDVLLIYGNAGTGKSQLLAHETQLLFKEGRECLLLISGIYFNDAPIQEQIMSNLYLDYSFNDLIDILETIGEKKNRIIPVFIDALNETGNLKLWKTGLSAIIDKVNHSRMVKLVLSYRTEYEKMVIPDTVMSKKNSKEIMSVFHNGFANTGIRAIKEFLNHYSIPFSPLEYFRFEMTNPLFLTLYCKNYNGTETNLPQLYDRLVESVNQKLYYSLRLSQNGYTEDINILKPLIMEIASIFISNNRRYITQEELVKLDYFQKYGLLPITVIHHLKGEGLLYTHVFNGQEVMFFSFDQMNDYFGAEAIFKSNRSKEEMRKYLSDNLLGIKNGSLKFFNNIALFINCCGFYAEKYHEECIDIINSVQDKDTKCEIFNYYMESFQWRQHIFLSAEQFKSLVKEYSPHYEDIWRMLIGNSVKTNHQFNADFLHSILSQYSLCDRDYFWTIYINGLPSNDDERIVQLITLYNKGDKLDLTDLKQIELLLTVLSWLLTSSNRWLRDNTSKAMIEILKEHFQYCQVILNKFKDVNDPYVIQRLYGIIFGACCKKFNSEEKIFRELAEYIYDSVFDQEAVYADILLRDYARLIIERFLYEYPNYSGIIERKKIIPPYSSDPIPEIENQHYLEQNFSGATYNIIKSMRFEGMGWYGDFGRYIFQSALNHFDVNEYQIFNYAIFHIINELDFSEELFKDYDMFVHRYNRHQTIKTERIGKKYQWITMYNVLARISDNCGMKESWQSSSDNTIQYEGAWNLYIRDFDPTLNANFLICEDAPIFSLLDEHRNKSIAEHRREDISTKTQQQDWINNKGYFLEQLKHTLILTDEFGNRWVFLTKYCDTDRHTIEIDKLHEWSWLYAYFMTSTQVDSCCEYIQKSSSVLESEIASYFQTYTIYNREYPWSPSCRKLIEDTWWDCHINTGEYEEICSNLDNHDYSILEQLLSKYCTDEDIDDIPQEYKIEEKSPKVDNIKPRLKEIQKDIGSILTSTVELVWEEEYDASKEKVMSICHPCPKLIQDMHLCQKKNEGYYYDDSGELAAFDIGLTQNATGVLVRKDILDKFLSFNDFKLVWLVDAEKAVHSDGYMISMSNRWKGILIYNDGNIEGEIYRIKEL